MDLTLTIIHVKGLIQNITKRVQISREEIQEKRPTATAYIEGANQTESELIKIKEVINCLETELRACIRENNYLTKINTELKSEINHYKNTNN